MHTAVSWVSRGKAQRFPTRYQLDEGELDRVSKLAKIRLEDAQLDLEAAQEEQTALDRDNEWEDEDSSDSDASDGMEGVEVPKKDPSDLSAYNLESYDTEVSRAAAPLGAFGNIKGLQFYKDAAEDPYITLKDDNDDDAQERAELEIYPTDNLIIAAKTVDDLSQLDIYVYDDEQENLYVHHDLLLPAMPLCLEWLDFRPAPGEAGTDSQSSGNFIAVGTLDPEIEIWSLDTLDGMYPDAILGKPPGAENSPEFPVLEELAAVKKSKKKTKKAPQPPVPQSGFHVDSVLALSWNRSHRNLLASASADATIKLWDLSLPTHSAALRSFGVHKDKVQALEWNQKEPTVLLSGSWDKTIKVFDTRAPDSAVGLVTDCDVECVRWNSWESHEFFISLENGLVQSHDSRMLSGKSKPITPLFTLSAHDKSVSALDYNTLVPGLLVTGGTDNIVKLWNVGNVGGKRSISLLASRDLGVGKVFAAHFCPDEPTCVAVGGSKGGLQIWDTATNPAVRKAFGDSFKALGKDVERKRVGVIGLQDEDEEGESAEEQDS